MIAVNMCLATVILLLFTWVSTALAGHLRESLYPFSISSILNVTNVTVGWSVNWPKQQVDFRVVVGGEEAQNVLIGFSDHGLEQGSDFCYFRQGILKDGWIDRKLILREDRQQDCVLHKRKSNKNRGVFYFSRKFMTCDPRDYAIEPGTTNILLAVSNEDMRQLDYPNVVYQMRHTQILQKHLPHSALSISGEQFKALEIRAHKVIVPAQRTTYWCQSIELDNKVKRRKHHIVKYEPIITKGLEHVIHHMEVFHCQKAVPQFSDYCTNQHAMPAAKSSCSKVIAAWSMGVGPVVYPAQAGMPIGGPDFMPFLMIEIHYDNAWLQANLTDSSGIRITYTNQLRPHDAGIMELGLIYSDVNSIPPLQPAFPMTGYCPADCTKQFPKDGINIFASQLHAHLTGRKLFTSQLRNGVKIGEINRDNHYSPHWQHLQQFSEHVKVLAGDVLSTTCVYDTTTKKVWTWGGYGIDDEMCVNYVHYYPATEIEVCKSAISNDTLRSFFKKLGVYKEELKIHEMYQAMHLNPDKDSLKDGMAELNLLKEYYHVSPLNVACLDRAGSPIKNPSGRNWENIKRPETFSGIYKGQKSRSTEECFATNI